MNQVWIEKLFTRVKGINKPRGIIRYLIMLAWVSILGFILWKIWGARNIIIPYLVEANYNKLIAVFIAYLASLAASTAGWCTIMHTLDKSIGWFKNAQIFALTLFGRRLPGTVWYIGGRMLIYNKLGVPNNIILFASGLELVLAIITGSLIGVFYLATTEAILPSKFVTLFIVVAAIGIFFLHPSTLKMIFMQENAKPKLNIKLKELFGLAAIYTMVWIFGGVFLAQLIATFNITGQAQDFKIIGIWAIAGTAGLLTFFLPSTFGVTELTIAALLAQSMPLPLAGIIAIVFRILTTVFELILAVIFHPTLMGMIHRNHLTVE